MAPRRPLVEGLKTDSGVDRAVEEDFVYNGVPTDARAAASTPATQLRERKGQAASTVGRVPLTTRVRAEFSAALKRASLERQLAGQVPNTLQDILEEALEPWLRSHGYLN